MDVKREEEFEIAALLQSLHLLMQIEFNTSDLHIDYQSSCWMSFIKNILGQHQGGGNLVTIRSQLMFSLREFDDPCNFLLLDNCILLLKAFSHQNI